ncbi:MAG: AAA family ATPase, partial [Geminicoccaceae bacterium]
TLAVAAHEKLSISLWPRSLVDFLDRKMSKLFTIRSYLLDPAKLVDPVDGRAKPQPLPLGNEPFDGNALDGLIQIDEISAQRGLGQASPSRPARDSDGSANQPESRGVRRLSVQLRNYYDKHLDPRDTPDPTDLQALEALDNARKAFDERLTDCFDRALKELEHLGYPGITDPKLSISTNIRLQDGLSHASAVQYQIPSAAGGVIHRLPEGSNGLGYQNLVSMVFALMSYRDAWMRVGKAGTGENATTSAPPPLHLVLIEEPEAYLHAQVQQVFIKHAYDVLRNHENLKDSSRLATQLVVSTHSSYVAHASNFSSLRYFRRLPATPEIPIPIASVINLRSVFGNSDQTAKFVTRYLKATHCDLSADGAVLIEGSSGTHSYSSFPVEEIAVRFHSKRCYISWMEIGGSHAHRLRGLIEHLGLTTLIVTDLDAKRNPIARKSRHAEPNNLLETKHW